jgi:nitrite reductase (NADH) small subunit
MSQCTRIASVSELPPDGEARQFAFGLSSVCVANASGTFAALGNICPHRGAPLAEGSVENGKLVCAWHGWEFSLSDGQCIHRPGVSVVVYELVICGEDVFLKS